MVYLQLNRTKSLSLPIMTQKIALCDTFAAQAVETFGLLQDARDTGVQLGEETLTDLNLLRLRQHHMADIKIRASTKPVEGKQGTDWEWWLIDSAGALGTGFGVQAKVLNLKTNCFPHLHYKKGKSYQSKKLEKHCKANTLYPLYCVYTNFDAKDVPGLDGCGTNPLNMPSYGCSLIPYWHVAALRDDKEIHDLKSVMAEAIPWQCLFCCEGYGGISLPERAHRFAQLRLLHPGLPFTANQKSKGRKFAPENPVGRTQVGAGEIPPYIRSILEGRSDAPVERNILIVQEKRPG